MSCVKLWLVLFWNLYTLQLVFLWIISQSLEFWFCTRLVFKTTVFFQTRNIIRRTTFLFLSSPCLCPGSRVATHFWDICFWAIILREIFFIALILTTTVSYHWFPSTLKNLYFRTKKTFCEPRKTYKLTNTLHLHRCNVLVSL